MCRLTLAPLLVCCGLACLSAGSGHATSAPASDEESWVRENKVNNLKALSKPVTLDVTDQPVADLFAFLAETTGAELEPIYLDDTRDSGIDPETTITIKATGVPGLILLERILDRVGRADEGARAYTWQFTETGSIEFGPRDALNRRQFLEVYDISELLFVVPRFDNAPEFDLASALQSSGGGGGGSPITGAGNNDDDDVSTEDRRKAIIDLIQGNIAPDEWVALGGSGASISGYGTSLLITAPDYIHRQINGYDFWPSRLQQVRQTDGRREVRIRPDTSPDRTGRPDRSDAP